MNDYDKRLDFDSDTFGDMKTDMNFVLQRLLGNMVEKQSTEGSMTIKIDVTMVKEFIPNYDPNIKGESREISKPQFKHKVTSAVKISDEKSGNLNNEMEMVMDEETGCYVLQPVANTQQRTIFDSDFMAGQNKEQDEGDVIDGNCIEGGERPALPGPQNGDEVIDGEFREVEGTKKCHTGWSKYGVCSCCGNNGVTCCAQCEEDCNSRCGWIEEPYKQEEESGEEPEDITDDILGDSDEEGYDYEDPEE